MTTRSIWEGTTPDTTSFPALQGDHTCNVVIIGGGITGITAAYLLSQAGVKTTLLEARKLGLGTTGNSTGNLYVTVDEHLSGIRKKWNKDVMRQVVNARGSALSFIEQMVSLHQLDCNFSRQPFVYYAEQYNNDIEKFLKDEIDAMQEAGVHAHIVDDAGLPFKTMKALRADGQAQFHPLKYVRGLANQITNCELYENSQVVEIDEDNGIVKTAGGSVKADKILMATHTPKGALAIHSVLGPYREFGVAAELSDMDFPGGIYWSLDAPKHSIRSLYDGDKKYVMVVGDKFKTGQHGNSFEHIQGLEQYLTQRLSISAPAFAWAGQQYRPADSLPYIGKADDRVYYLTGFATDGLVYGTLAAMIVTDTITGKQNEWADTFKASRHTPFKSAKAFVKENIDNALEYLKDMPGSADASSVEDVKAGEGKVISHKGEKLAVYKDEQGRVHTCSAVCTHMDCIVNWNAAEKSWDCPCHGSRFDYDGKLLEGPAVADLPKKNL